MSTPPIRPLGDPGVPQALRRGLFAGLALCAIVIPPSLHVDAPRRDGAALQPAPPAHASPPRSIRVADFGTHTPSADAQHVADWVADSRDNAGAAFVIVDKRLATVYVFDADAHLRGFSPVLLGASRGDDSVPGIGTRPIAEVLPQERTTPAGRFVAERGRNTLGEDVVWVDYDAAVSMHRVRNTNPSEHRLARLATPTVADNRISYGCINVPVAFFENTLAPVFSAQRAPVYVLPEVKPLEAVFGSAPRQSRTSPTRPEPAA